MEDYHHGDICYADEGPEGCRGRIPSAPNPIDDGALGSSDRHGQPCALPRGECIPETDLTAHTSAQDFGKDFWHDDGPGLDLAREGEDRVWP